MVESNLKLDTQVLLEKFNHTLESNPLYNYNINDLNLAMINEEHKFSDLFEENFKNSNLIFFDLIDGIVLSMVNEYYPSINGKEKYEMIIYPIIMCLFKDEDEEYKNIVNHYFDKIIQISYSEEDFSNYKNIELIRLITILTHFGIIADKVYSAIVFNIKSDINSHKYIFNFVKRIIKIIDSSVYYSVSLAEDKYVTSFLFYPMLFKDLYKVEDSSNFNFPVFNYTISHHISKLIQKCKINNTLFYIPIRSLFFEEFLPFYNSKNVYDEFPLSLIEEDTYDVGFSLFD